MSYLEMRQDLSFAGTATVGTPVTRRPPCRPGRAVFPPPVPRLPSRPRTAEPFPARAMCARARREVGAGASGPTWPGCVSWPGCGLPSRPSPWRGLAPPPRPRLDTTPPLSPTGWPCDRTSPPACAPRSVWGLPSATTPLCLPATACGLRRTCTASPRRRGAWGLRER